MICGGVKRGESISQHYVSMNIPHCDVLRRKLVLGMYKRVSSSPNELINTISDATHFCNSRMFRSWMSILYM